MEQGSVLKKTFGIALSMVALPLTYVGALSATAVIEFNMDVLDIDDRANLDLSRFSRAGYIMPGQYQMTLKINQLEYPNSHLEFVTPAHDPLASEPCLLAEHVDLFGLKSHVQKNLRWHEEKACLDSQSIPGMTVRGDVASDTLYITIPQAWLEYRAPNWDPPSRWDNGVAGALLDYNLNAQGTWLLGGGRLENLSGNGTTGFNYDAWRFRADWQAQYQYEDRVGYETRETKRWTWNRFYAYRAVPAWQSKLTLGEDYLNSGMFDSFRFTGASLMSDDNMLPPNLRGYAPEVTGVARTNATVTVRQQGRVLYETQVAQGAFRIQDLNQAVSGKLDVTVLEQDGSEHTFQVDSANIPYLTRPGQVRFNVAAGQSTDYQRDRQGPGFATGEFSWGVNNGWSLFGGALLAGDYNAVAAGVGRDLLTLGALSFDITQSQAQLPKEDKQEGRSYRLSYAKRFDQYDSQITFAGYRFAERHFMSMAEYINARYYHSVLGQNKALYTITFNKSFPDWKTSFYFNYNHQTYWDRPDNDRYNVSASRYFNLGPVKNVSANLSAYRTRYNRTYDDGMYISLSLPWDNGSTFSYTGQVNNAGNSHTAGFSQRINDNAHYRLNAGTGLNGKGAVNGYAAYTGDIAQSSVSASYLAGQYRSVGLYMQGGATATAQGAALHKTSVAGGTRLMVDTSGLADVPVVGNGSVSRSNEFGKAVIAGVNSYYRSQAHVDISRLDDDIEAINSVISGTLTEGAIGYRQFRLISGEKRMAVVTLPNGQVPPFGTVVYTEDRREAGMMNDGGSVYLTGITPSGTMWIRWGEARQCQITLPSELPPPDAAPLSLLCLPSGSESDPLF